jgi:uncharacterized protein (TIGR03118 family)
VQAPSSFGEFAGAILIGNFGDGRIHAFDSNTGDFLGPVTNTLGQEILIDGLWTLTVGNGTAGGDSSAIYFTAGPNGEKHGLFGSPRTGRVGDSVWNPLPVGRRGNQLA